jgi:hypothetical protein
VKSPRTICSAHFADDFTTPLRLVTPLMIRRKPVPPYLPLFAANCTSSNTQKMYRAPTGNSPSSSQRPLPSPTSSRPQSRVEAPAPDEASGSRYSYSSGSTAVSATHNEYGYGYGYGYEKQGYALKPQEGQQPQTRQQLPALPSIDVGAPLEFDYFTNDTPAPRMPRQHPPQSYTPFQPPPQAYGAYDQDRARSQMPSRADNMSRASSVGPSWPALQSLPSAPTIRVSPAVTGMARHSTGVTSYHTGISSQPTGLPTILESGFSSRASSVAPLDHFRYDAEAHASGMASQASYRPPRSRSPTPGVEEDEYLISNDGQVQYTGYMGSPSKATEAGVDDEEDDDDDDDETDSEDDDDETEHGEMDEKWDSGEQTPTEGVLPHTRFPRPAEVRSFNSAPSFTSAPSDVGTAPTTTRHFGPVPVGRIHRRHNARKRVPLRNGHLVVELEVPPKLVLPYHGEPEMQTTRYTAVTGDPDEFLQRGFSLRQNEYGRDTELFIVMTMFNVCKQVNFFLSGTDEWLNVPSNRKMRCSSVAPFMV